MNKNYVPVQYTKKADSFIPLRSSCRAQRAGVVKAQYYILDTSMERRKQTNKFSKEFAPLSLVYRFSFFSHIPLFIFAATDRRDPAFSHKQRWKQYTYIISGSGCSPISLAFLVERKGPWHYSPDFSKGSDLWRYYLHGAILPAELENHSLASIG